MKYEEKLTLALDFLNTNGAKGDSFDYYDNKARDRGYETWLFKYLSENGVPENEHYAIVQELSKRGLIEVFPHDSKVTAIPPQQIKISFKGMAKANASADEIADSAERQKQDAEITFLRLTNEQLKKADKIRWQGYVFGMFMALIGVSPTIIEKVMPKQDQINVKIISDSTNKIPKQP